MSAVLVAGLTGSALGAVMVGDLLADQGGWLTWALFVAATALSLWCTVRAALVHVDATPTELRCAGILRDRWLPWAEITGIEIYVDRRGHPVSLSVLTVSDESITLMRVGVLNWEAQVARLRGCAPPRHVLHTDAGLPRVHSKWGRAVDLPRSADADPGQLAEREQLAEVAPDRAGAQSPIVVRGGRVLPVFGTIWFGAALLLPSWAVIGPGLGTPDWLALTYVIGMGCAILVLAVRSARRRLEATPSGVRCRGCLRTRTFAWTEIAKIRLMRIPGSTIIQDVEVVRSGTRTTRLGPRAGEPVEEFLRACRPHVPVVESSEDRQVVQGEREHFRS